MLSLADKGGKGCLANADIGKRGRLCLIIFDLCLFYEEKKKKIPMLTCHLSPVTCHLSSVTCHISCVTCHMSPLTCSYKNSHSNRSSLL